MPLGIIVGVGLLVLVTSVALAIGAQVHSRISQFREEHHQNFMGSERQ